MLTIARRGADQLDYIKHQAIEAIEEAREAGHTGKYNGFVSRRCRSSRR